VTLSVTILKKSWEDLVSDFGKRVFVPTSEGDIQCYLYHLCVMNGLEVKKLHAEEVLHGRDKTTFTDLVLGTRPDTKLYVEIKWTKTREEPLISKRRLERIWKDIEKSKTKKSKRRRYMLILLYKEKGGAPLLKSDLSKSQKSELRMTKKEMKAKGVKVIFSV